MKQYAIAIHGGAGTILRSQMTPEKESAYTLALQTALQIGETILRNGGSSLDAVESSVKSLEDCPLFNAGKGAVFTHDGQHELDASIMFGKDLSAGAVAGIRLVKNPVQLAKQVMQHSEHVFMAGHGAEEFARKWNIPFETKAYFFNQFRYDQFQEALRNDTIQMDHTADKEKKFGTVGAVALDLQGNLAAATSTGGMTNKRHGRVGDTPMIGAGTYANNATCAVSCTGHGEYFIRSVVAYDISCLMEYKGLSLQQACDTVVKQKLVKMGGEGGLIALDHQGHVELCFNSEGMYRASVKQGEKAFVGIYSN